MGTVVGIIDGTGSLGAAYGQVAVIYIDIYNYLQIGVTAEYTWNGVFVLMSFMILMSSLPLLKSVKREFGEILTLRKLKKEIEQK